MKAYDERLHYYVTLARLLCEADLQLEGDASSPGSSPYAERLQELRQSVSAAIAASMHIVAEVQGLRAQMAQVAPVIAAGEPAAELRVKH